MPTSTSSAIAVKEYNFEVYTCNPQTGECGWDIKMVSVFADSMKAAKQALKDAVPHFDEIILNN
jgi:hypothetical protein